jgi:hypothetical protein
MARESRARGVVRPPVRPGGDQQALAEGLAGFGVEHRLEAGEGGGGGFGRGGGIGLGGEALAVAGEHKAQAVEAGGEEHRRVVGRLAALAAPPAAAHQLVEGVGKRRDVSKRTLISPGAAVAGVADPRRQARHLQQAAQAFEGAGFVRRGQLRAGEADPAVVLDAGEGVVHRRGWPPCCR